MIKKFKLNAENFPQVLERLKKKALRYTLWEKDWYGCEERFCLYDDVLGYLVEDLANKSKFQEAWSIIKRYNLLEKGMIKKKETLEFFEKHQLFEVLGNPIFVNDSFNPVEENLGIVKKGHYINLRDFGLKEENVHYIDNVKNDKFIFAKNELESSELVKIKKKILESLTLDWNRLRIYYDVHVV